MPFQGVRTWSESFSAESFACNMFSSSNKF